MSVDPKDYLGKLWARISMPAADACWDWQGPCDSRGYGHLKLDGRNTRAHRAAWESAFGPIPVGYGHHGVSVIHSCDNRKCCNPRHLRLGTHADNMADMKAKGRRKAINTGPRNGRSKLSLEQVAAIRGDTRGKRTIAKEYGVSPAQVQRVRLGIQWK